ncbi:hypothetical protein [Paenibacillus sp. DYY-L-2]|uniref:hypothetical protein n=1 Tax=Paenibacillus sp. DYY-L-2 TaxID=3447013 RepID=UPI003F4F756A
MLRILKITFISVLTLSLLAGCIPKSQKNAIFNKAVPIAKEYMKTHFNTDVVISEYYEINDPITYEIVLYGHMVSDPEENFHIAINHKSYEVTSLGGASEIMDRAVISDNAD